jgi:putative ABC transport system substrate-binding protein
MREAGRIAKRMSETGRPAVYGFPYQVESGGLMSYGPQTEGWERDVASLIARILQGESPASIPVQQPTRFTFVVNPAAARAIGLTIPKELLLRADKVLE